MKYNININQKLCFEQKISFKAAALLDLFSELSSWANAENFEDGVYYYLAYNKILTDLPLVFSSKRTAMRFVKELKEKGLIEQCKKGKFLENYVRISPKGKSLLRFDKNGEGGQGSPKMSKGLDKIGEPKKDGESIDIVKDDVQGSPILSTYNNNIITYNNLYSNFKAIGFLINENKYAFEVFEMQYKKSISNYLDFLEFFEIKVEEEEIEYNENKLMGRLKRLAFHWRSNQNKNKGLYEGKLDVELKWFIDLFNTISNGNYKPYPEYKPLLDKLMKVGFKGEDFRLAIRNLYSSSPANKFHIQSNFKFATPEYLLKHDNLNKYLNFKVA